MSASKFARDPWPPLSKNESTTKGKVGFSTGAGFLAEEEQDHKYSAYLNLFPVEGSLSFWLGDIYDLTFAVNLAWQLSTEGNLRLLQKDRFRLGFVHGVNLGLSVDFQDKDVASWDSMFLYGLSGGLMAQWNSGERGVLIAGAKYTFSSYETFSDEEQEPEDHTHYLTGSLGYMFYTGRLRITPEIILSFGDWNVYFGSQAPLHRELWFVVSSVTFAAVY
jgi:hypothetical protein